MKEVLRTTIQVAQMLKQPTSRRLALMEGPTNCNRKCDYCVVPERWNREEASTLEQTYRQIDWLRKEGFCILNYIGGEPLAECQPRGDAIPQSVRQCLYFNKMAAQPEETIELSAPFRTKEGLTFAEHTLKVIEYASKKGMLTNVTINGDFVDCLILEKLKKAGLDTLTFSLHSLNENALKQIISRARMTAREGIIPIVSVVFTKDRTENILRVAEICAANGLIFSTAIVQEHGGGFSAVPKESQIPDIEEQKSVFAKLLKLKKAGFVRNNVIYLQMAPDFPCNSWWCNPKKDSFVHIRAIEEGRVDVCQEVPTSFQVGEIHIEDERWRETKQALVEKCKGCLYACHFESENPKLKGDLRTLLNMLLIKSGHPELVKMLGRKALGAQISEIKPIPPSEDEKFQIRMKEYVKICNKAKRAAFSVVGIAENIAILTVFIGFGLTRRQSPSKSLKAYFIWMTLRGL